MYFSIIILITDYFLKYFSLSWARKNRPQKMKINMVWESSNIEFIFVTILQFVITPLLIFNFIYIDLRLYLLEIETIKNSIFLLNIVGIFGFTFLIFPIFFNLLAKKNYRLMLIIDFSS